MFKSNQARAWALAIFFGFSAFLLYTESTWLKAGQPAKHGMIATTERAVWHLQDGRLRYCIIRSAEIFCIEEK